jgi:hypothetical protein
MVAGSLSRIYEGGDVTGNECGVVLGMSLQYPMTFTKVKEPQLQDSYYRKFSQEWLVGTRS